MELNEKQHQFYEDGYLVFDEILDKRELDFYLSPLRDLVYRSRNVVSELLPWWVLERDGEGKPIAGFLHKVQSVCVIEEKILNLIRNPILVGFLQHIIGDDIDAFATKFFPKLPRGGVSVKWHQDNFYFGTDSDKIISCVFYLDDSSRDNGCLRVIPKSHQSKEIHEHSINPNAHYRGRCINLEDESNAVDVEVKAGSAVLLSANLMHGSHENTTQNKSRYSVALHYKPSYLPLNPDYFSPRLYKDLHTVSKSGWKGLELSDIENLSEIAPGSSVRNSLSKSML